MGNGNTPKRILLAGHYRNWNYHPTMECADLDGDIDSMNLEFDIARQEQSRRGQFCDKCRKYEWNCCRENCVYENSQMV